MTKIYVTVIDETTEEIVTDRVDVSLYEGETQIRHGISEYWNVESGKEYRIVVLNGPDYYGDHIIADEPAISSTIWIKLKAGDLDV